MGFVTGEKGTREKKCYVTIGHHIFACMGFGKVMIDDAWSVRFGQD